MNIKRLIYLPKDFPVPIRTLYNWHSINKFPGLFVKIGGNLCIDMDKYEEIATRKNDKKAA